MLSHNIVKMAKLSKYLIWYSKLFGTQAECIDFIGVFMRDNKLINEKLKEITPGFGNAYLKDDAIKVSINVISNEILSIIKEIELDTDKHLIVENMKVTMDQKDMVDVISDIVNRSTLDKTLEYIMNDQAIKEYTNTIIKRNLDHYVSKVINDNMVNAYDVFGKLAIIDVNNMLPEVNNYKEFLNKRKAYINTFINEEDNNLTTDFGLLKPVKVEYEFNLLETLTTEPVDRRSYTDVFVDLVKNLYKSKKVLEEYNKYLKVIEDISINYRNNIKDNILTLIKDLVLNMKDGKLTKEEYITTIEKTFKIIIFNLETTLIIMNKVVGDRNKFIKIVNVINAQYKLITDVIDKVSRIGDKG